MLSQKLVKFVILLFISALAVTPVHAQWDKKQTGTTNLLESIYFLNDSVGFACGWKGTVLKTNNAGENWTDIGTSQNLIYKDVLFVDSTKGIIVGEDQFMYKTYNAGQNWIQKNTTSDLTRILQGIDVYNTSKMIAVGFRGYIIQSSDTGNTWKLDSIGSDSIRFRNLNIYDITVLPGGKCFAVGDSSMILSKNIDDTVWKQEFIGFNIPLKGISFINDSIGYVAGGSVDTSTSTFVNVFYKTINGGRTWSNPASITNGGTINTIHFVNKDTGYVASNSGRIFRTYNGANTWKQLPSKTPSTLYSIHFFNDTSGLICGDGGVLLKTKNNGGYPVSVVKVNNPLSINIYPNPASTELYFKFNDIKLESVILTSSLGQKINYTNITNNKLNISNLAKGIYYVTVYYHNTTDEKQTLVVNKTIVIN